MPMIVRNEADILEDVLVYHLNQGVDHVLAVDDRSTDATPDILNSFERCGLLTVAPRPSGTWRQDEARWRTRLVRAAVVDLAADWVLPTDGDSFWWPLWGNLKDALAAVPPECEAVVAPQSDFVFIRETQGPVVHALHIREVESPLGEKVVFRGFADVVVGNGSHRVGRRGELEQLTRFESAVALRWAPWTPLRCFHYGIRTDAKLASEVRDPKTEDPVARWVPRHERAESVMLDLSGPGRTRLIREGLADGRLVEDGRVSEALRRCLDPRQPGWQPPGEGELRPKIELTPELTEVKQLVMDALQHREDVLRHHGRKLAWRLEKHRKSAARGPRSALARIWSRQRWGRR